MSWALGAAMLGLMLGGAVYVANAQIEELPSTPAVAPQPHPAPAVATTPEGPVGRYRIETLVYTNYRGLLFKIDTVTGKTWYISTNQTGPTGTWREMK